MKSFLQKKLSFVLMITSLASSQSTLFINARLPGQSRSVSIFCDQGRIQTINDPNTPSADQVVDLQGGTIYPGFTDAHLHLLGLGQSMEIIDLVGTADPEDILQRVQTKAQTTPTGQWIQGRGWDQNDWPEIRLPDRTMLDAVTPDHPVLLSRIDGHAVWVNSRALQIAGVDAHTPDPSGGKIYRDREGVPTGVLVDNAVDLVMRHVPEDSRDAKKRQLINAAHYLNSMGITAVHDAGTSRETLDILNDLEREGRLTLRVYAMLNDNPEDYEPFLLNGPDTTDPWITVRAIKLYLDGALGSRGAALLEPYADDPENRGLLVSDLAKVAIKVRRFNAAGFQVNIHCIGDRANRMALDIFERVGLRERRNRIEHAQIISPEDIPRFFDLGVIPSMQAIHCTSDMYWADERLGPERLPEAYPWQSLLRLGAIIPGGSDAPVEVPNPLWGFYAAVTRQDHQNWPQGGWLPQERMTPEQALKMLTEWPAYAAFQESQFGQIKPGYWADFTVLSRDLLAATPHQILDTDVLFTIVNGHVVYSQP